jgi:hypothetical protein
LSSCLKTVPNTLRVNGLRSLDNLWRRLDRFLRNCEIRGNDKKRRDCRVTRERWQSGGGNTLRLAVKLQRSFVHQLRYPYLCRNCLSRTGGARRLSAAVTVFHSIFNVTLTECILLRGVYASCRYPRIRTGRGGHIEVPGAIRLEDLSKTYPGASEKAGDGAPRSG